MKTDLKKILGQNWPFGLWYVIGRSVTEWHWWRTLRVIVKLGGPSTGRQGESSCNILCTLLMQNSCRLQCSFKVQFCAREAVTAGQWPLWMHCWPLLNPCTLSSSSSIINRTINNMMSILIASLIVYLKTTLHFLIPTMILLSDKICTLHNCTIAQLHMAGPWWPPVFFAFSPPCPDVLFHLWQTLDVLLLSTLTMFSVPDYSNVDKLVSSHLLGGVPPTIVFLNCPLVVHVEELADQLKHSCWTISADGWALDEL